MKALVWADYTLASPALGQEAVEAPLGFVLHRGFV